MITSSILDIIGKMYTNMWVCNNALNIPDIFKNIIYIKSVILVKCKNELDYVRECIWQYEKVDSENQKASRTIMSCKNRVEMKEKWILCKKIFIHCI